MNSSIAEQADQVEAEAYADAYADGWPRLVAEKRAAKARAAFLADA